MSGRPEAKGFVRAAAFVLAVAVAAPAYAGIIRIDLVLGATAAFAAARRRTHRAL